MPDMNGHAPAVHARKRPPAKQNVRQSIVRDPHFVLPHVETFAGKFNVINKNYYVYFDEALRDSQQNTLAMRRDIFIHELLRHRQLPVACLPWHVQVDDPDHPDQKSIGDTLGKIARNVPRLRTLIVSLLEAFFYGKYAAQIQLGPRRVAGNVWNSITSHFPINGDKLRYKWDGTPGIAIRTGSQDEYTDSENAFLNAYSDCIEYSMLGAALFLKTSFLRDRFIIHEFEPSDTDYLFEIEQSQSIHGLGLRSRSYWGWNLRTELLSWMVNALQRVGANGMLYAFYQEGNDNSKQAVLAALQQLVQDNYSAFPYKGGTADPKDLIQRLEPSAVGYDVLKQLIDWIEGIIRRAYLGQDLSSESSPTGLGSGVAQLQGNVRADYIDYDASMIAETLTEQLLSVILKYNKFKYEGKEYYGSDLPFSCWWEFQLARENVEAAISAASSLYQMGVDLDADDLRKKAGLSPPKKEDTKVVNVEIKQALDQYKKGIPDMNQAAGKTQELMKGIMGKAAGAGVLPNQKQDQNGQPQAPAGQPQAPAGLPKPGAARMSRFSRSPETVSCLAGELYLSSSGWGLMKVPNDLVRGIFDAIHDPGVTLPPQDSDLPRSKWKVNAHVSVLRPEEIEQIGGSSKITDWGHHFHYQLGPVKKVKPHGWESMKEVYFVDIDSPDLEEMREKYGLSRLPNKGKFRFHVTVGVKTTKPWSKSSRFAASRAGRAQFARAGSAGDCGHDRPGPSGGDFSVGNTCAEGDGFSDEDLEDRGRSDKPTSGSGKSSDNVEANWMAHELSRPNQIVFKASRDYNYAFKMHDLMNKFYQHALDLPGVNIDDNNLYQIYRSLRGVTEDLQDRGYRPDPDWDGGPGGKPSEETSDAGGPNIEVSDSHYDKHSINLFGKKVPPKDVLNLVAVDELEKHFPGLKYDIRPDGTGGFEVYANDDRILVSRYIAKDAHGDLFIHNNEIDIKMKSEQHKGIGIQIFSDQVDNAVKAGVKYIECYAAGSKNNPNGYNGYYTWPRFGYQGKVHLGKDFYHLSDFIGRITGMNEDEVNKGFEHGFDISRFMETKEGRDFWKDNGSGISDMKFDLTEGSLSRRILSAYRKEVGRDDPAGPDRYNRRRTWDGMTANLKRRFGSRENAESNNRRRLIQRMRRRLTGPGTGSDTRNASSAGGLRKTRMAKAGSSDDCGHEPSGLFGHGNDCAGLSAAGLKKPAVSHASRREAADRQYRSDFVSNLHKAAASVPAEHRRGTHNNKIWIYDLWKEFKNLDEYTSYDKFKKMLIDLNRSREIDLSRHDMPQALNKEELHISQMSSTMPEGQEAEFHQVVIQ